MNESEILGQWKQVKGLMKLHWGELNDDELTKADGKLDMIAGLIQTKYGHTKEVALKEVNDFLAGVKSNLSNEVSKE